MKIMLRIAVVGLLMAGGVAFSESAYEALAPTPPMGWNSWNAFHKDIDEEKIQGIADAMVDSGMRDAGYEYLVLDDAWMAAERDEAGRLQGDPKKFPGGMKAIGDYIHAKGLKFGVYEDRADKTCQQLPGMLGNEALDIETFASWGVDYMKIDSCFAEWNGRLSSEDYALLKECILATGRPMVLSISDFGQGAWAWGGAKSAHLWRTSYDIFPFMNSVYNHADSSGGDRVIHPAFNGLWQFAGPGHWNDPDMMEVGNLKTDAENRIHFSLWCVLAAPLMAGNDLRTMDDTVRTILTAPEIIAVNQDARGIQGYKVYDDGDREVYNKPLNDGTTAVLLLNKGKDAADVAVTWEKIGLSGEQLVRDLWARQDLGTFADGFTAKGLEQHGQRFLRVGTPGSALVPAPEPLAVERYTVTRKGTTYLGDLCYIWKNNNAPESDTDAEGGGLCIGDRTFEKGLGCAAKSMVMYKVQRAANRFRAVVGLDDAADAEASGRFKVWNEDHFGRQVLFDSGQMRKGDLPKAVDVDIRHVDCLMLSFENGKGRRGKNEGLLGNWGDARVVAE